MTAMTFPLKAPSKRFLRAAETERAQLLAQHQRLLVEHQRLLDEARRLAEGAREIEDRLSALDTVLGVDPDHVRAAQVAQQPQRSAPADSSRADPARVLSGPDVRETAVQVLLQQPEYIEALHYRQWYELLVNAGYAVAGKDPRAVFLTQITRSPVVRKSGQVGIYELDRQAPLRLRQRFERLQSELRDLSTAPPGETGATNASQLRELTTAIERTERDLTEALRVLRRDPSEADEGTVAAQRLTA